MEIFEMKRFIAFAAIVLAFGATAKATQFTGQISSGGGDSFLGGQYAGTFDVSPGTSIAPGAAAAFCVDLSDHVYFGPYTFTGTKSNTIPDDVPDGIWVHPPDDTGNRLSYILTQIWQPGLKGLSGDALAAWNGAVQYLLWNVANGASYDGSSYGGGNPYFHSDWVSIVTAYAGYDSTKNYDKGVFFILPDAGGGPTGEGPREYQILVGVTPEPSSMAIAGLGVLGMVGYGLKRRRG
jgi:hypothetical protein